MVGGGGDRALQVTSPVRGALGKTGVIYFGNSDGITAPWAVRCLMICILERDLGAGRGF